MCACACVCVSVCVCMYACVCVHILYHNSQLQCFDFHNFYKFMDYLQEIKEGLDTAEASAIQMPDLSSPL